MPKIRSMSAGRAGASLYNSNVNGNQGGGNKKGGLATTTNKRVQFVLNAIRSRAYSSPDQRKMIYCVNQLGGIGAPSKMFAPTADGSCASCSKEAKAHNFVVLAYRQLLGRGADESGLRKYTKQILNDPRGLGAGMSQVSFDLTNSPEGRKFTRKIGSVEAQKRIDATNTYIENATTVPDSFSPIEEETEEETKEETEEEREERERKEECDRIDLIPDQSPIWKKVTKMLKGCDVDGSLSVDDLENYLLEGFTKELEAIIDDNNNNDDLTEEEKAQENARRTREIGVMKANAREIAKTMITYYDTSGDGVISVTEISNNSESDLMKSQRDDERKKCFQELNNDFFNTIETYNTTDREGWITQSDWATYINSSDKHPAFKLEHWDESLGHLGLAFETFFDGALMMLVADLGQVVIPTWKISRQSDNPDSPLTDAQFIDLLNNDDGVETIEFDICPEESFVIDTTGTSINRSPTYGYEYNKGFRGIDTYLALYDRNGVLVKQDDDHDGGMHDARITLNQNEITYDDENKAVYYALAIPLVFRKFMDRTNDGLERVETNDKRISQLQNITCEALCHQTHDFLKGGTYNKLRINNTIVKPSVAGRQVPVYATDIGDDERVSYGDLKLWYEGNSVSSVDGTTNYDAPRLHSSKIYDLRNENCHKWVKITLKKVPSIIFGDSFVSDYGANPEAPPGDGEFIALTIDSVSDILSPALTGEEEWTSKTLAKYLQDNWTLSINRNLSTGGLLDDGEWSEFSNIEAHLPENPTWGGSTNWVYLKTTPVFTDGPEDGSGNSKIKFTKK